jgi:hypothetical protein
MDMASKGRVLAEQEVTVSALRTQAFTDAVGTRTAAQTATLVSFFGATVGGESTVVTGLGMDLSRSLLAGLAYEWHRPFAPEEVLKVRVAVEDVYAKGSNQFGIVSAEFSDRSGGLVQRQLITFVERETK